MRDRKLRVISIAHTAVSRAAGRLRYAPLAGRDDLEVHLVVPRRWKQFGRTILADPADDPGVNTHVLPILFPNAGPLGWYLHVYAGLGRLIRQVQPDVIHLWEEPWSFVALQATLMKGNAGLVLEVDQNILKRLPPPFELIRKKVLRQTDYILARSNDAIKVVEARGYDGPVSMIGYGVDKQVFKPSAPPIALRDPSQLVLGYVGRLIEEKGVDDVLDAMARITGCVCLRLMGEGPHESALRERADALGLSERLSIEPWGEPAQVAVLLQSLDALVLMTRTTPAVKEQFGRVIIEAQGCGVPVIGAKSGSIPEVIGKGGWIVPQRDPASLAALLERIQADPQDRIEKAAAALENVEKRFTYEAIADQLTSAWAAAAQRKRS